MAAAPQLTIVVDPGHGGTETGAIGPGGLQEKDATLEIARRLAATLPRVLSCRTVLTRDTDVLLTLDDRTSIANHERADLFLSIHANSSRSASAQGSETYYLSLEASDKIAQEVASRENASNGDGARSGRRHRESRPRLHPLGPGAERPPQGIERARRGDPDRAQRGLRHGQPRHQAGALPGSRRRHDARRARRGRVHLQRRRREAAAGPRVPAGGRPTPWRGPSPASSPGGFRRRSARPRSRPPLPPPRHEPPRGRDPSRGAGGGRDRAPLRQPRRDLGPETARSPPVPARHSVPARPRHSGARRHRPARRRDREDHALLSGPARHAALSGGTRHSEARGRPGLSQDRSSPSSRRGRRGRA